VVARISGANMTRANVTLIFDKLAMSKTRSDPLCAIWTIPRAFAIWIVSAMPGGGGAWIRVRGHEKIPAGKTMFTV
jgi:hypothetical protein